MRRATRGDGTTRSHRPFALAIIAGVCLTGGACGQSAASPTPLVVMAPVTLQVPLLAARGAIADRHPGWQIDFDFVTQLSPATVSATSPDVVTTSDSAAMAQLEQSALVQAPHPLAHDLLEIVVPDANPNHIGSLADLARTGIRVAVPDPSTPTGQQSRQILTDAKLRLNTLAAADPSAALDLVAVGAADAALVETSDFKAAPAGMRELPVAPLTAAMVAYQIAVVKGSAHLPAAQALENELLGPGQVSLRDHGFLSP